MFPQISLNTSNKFECMKHQDIYFNVWREEETVQGLLSLEE